MDPASSEKSSATLRLERIAGSAWAALAHCATASLACQRLGGPQLAHRRWYNSASSFLRGRRRRKEGPV